MISSSDPQTFWVTEEGNLFPLSWDIFEDSKEGLSFSQVLEEKGFTPLQMCFSHPQNSSVLSFSHGAFS